MTKINFVLDLIEIPTRILIFLTFLLFFAYGYPVLIDEIVTINGLGFFTYLFISVSCSLYSYFLLCLLRINYKSFWLW